MTETPLEKVLRLAATPVRSHTRVRNGRVQQVHQYQENRMPGKVPAGVGVRKSGGAKSPTGIHSVAFGSLKPGQVVQVANTRYNVLKVNVPPPASLAPAPNLGAGVNTGGPGSTGTQGSGVNTSGPGSTGSQGAGLNTGSQNPQQALLGNASVRAGTPQTTSEWKSQSTGSIWFVTLPTSFPVQVVGQLAVAGDMSLEEVDIMRALVQTAVLAADYEATQQPVPVSRIRNPDGGPQLETQAERTRRVIEAGVMHLIEQGLVVVAPDFEEKCEAGIPISRQGPPLPRD